MTISVIIVTLNRPDCVSHCLDCLLDQVPRPNQIIIVDASPDDHTRRIVDRFYNVVYLRNENGYGRMTASRNIGLKVATGEIIAFLDDDAFPHPGWLENLVATYTDEKIGAVGGRALNNQSGEEALGVNEIGKLKPNGVLTGYFAANPGKVVEVDHVMGCNMSFRRNVVAQLGGFREDYPGISGVREDSDMCLRVKALGYNIFFNPAACVDHAGAPQAKGQNFDTRYVYYSERNHLTLLIRNFGPGAAIVWRYLGSSAVTTVLEFAKRLASSTARLGVGAGGAAVGIACGLSALLRTGRDPVRHDPEGQAISRFLGNTSVEEQPVA